jgi:hypothetical protein
MKAASVLLIASALAIASSQAGDNPAFTIHEWGTFTTVSGSDGVLLPGLQREEEPLPFFVQSLAGMGPQFGKGWQRPLANVIVKMETPVIYFYTTEKFSAHVHVGFNGGSISQWFPTRSSGENPSTPNFQNSQPSGGDIDFAKGYKGSIDWNVQVEPSSANDSETIFKSGETLTWVYPRQPSSAIVRAADGTAEKFLFYRGIGNFSLPVKFTLPDSNTIKIENTSDSAVPSMLVFNSQNGQVSFTLLNSINAKETQVVQLTTLKASTNWQHEVYAAMRGALTHAGLFPKEADAMLQTWWRSYFERPGLRAFWIVPENFTRATLPLSIEPAPQNQVRVLVGRSELLTPSFEQELVKQFSQPDQNPWMNDRFFAAYEARVRSFKPRERASLR